MHNFPGLAGVMNSKSGEIFLGELLHMLGYGNHVCRVPEQIALHNFGQRLMDEMIHEDAIAARNILFNVLSRSMPARRKNSFANDADVIDSQLARSRQGPAMSGGDADGDADDDAGDDAGDADADGDADDDADDDAPAPFA